MAALRTQIYLTAAQRSELDDRSSREGVSLAELIRDAVDEYLAARPATVDEALDASFGAIPEATVPSRSEWNSRPSLDG